MGECHCVVAT